MRINVKPDLLVSIHVLYVQKESYKFWSALGMLCVIVVFCYKIGKFL